MKRKKSGRTGEHERTLSPTGLKGLAAYECYAVRTPINVVPVLPVLPRDPNYAFRVPAYEQMLNADAEERLNELVGEVTTPGTHIRTIAGHGDAASEIVRIAEKENVDMIVIATHGMAGWRRVVFGSVAERVVRLAKCPVLTTRVSQAEP